MPCYEYQTLRSASNVSSDIDLRTSLCSCRNSLSLINTLLNCCRFRSALAWAHNPFSVFSISSVSIILPKPIFGSSGLNTGVIYLNAKERMATLDSRPGAINPLLRLSYRLPRRMNDLFCVLPHDWDRMQARGKGKVGNFQPLGPLRQDPVLHQVLVVGAPC